jgi:hypothetical protein
MMLQSNLDHGDNDGWLKTILQSNLDHGDWYFYLVTALSADVISEDPDFAKKLTNS